MRALLKDMRPELIGASLSAPFGWWLNGWLFWAGPVFAIVLVLIARYAVYGPTLRYRSR